MAPAGTPWFLWRITVSSLMCAKLEAWPYCSTFWSMQIDLLQGKTGNSVFLSAPSVLSLNLCWIGTVSPQEPIKNYFFVCYCLVGLMDASPIGFQILMFQWPGGSFTRWGARYWVQCLCSSGRSWELWVPSWLYDSVLGMWFRWECVSAFSTQFNVDIFFAA